MTDHAPQAHFVLADLPAKGARLWPDRTALLWDTATSALTWRELHDRTMRLVSVLRDHGLGPGDRIGVLAPNGPAYFEIFFACAHAGTVMVPLNTRLAPGELTYQLEDAKVRLLLLHPDLQDLATAVGDATRPTLLLGVAYDDALLAVEPAAAEPARDDSRPVVQMYTSGTTGVPKGCLQTSSAWLQSCLGFSQALGLPHGARVAAGAPYFHSFGLGLGLAHLLVGGTVAVVSGLEGTDFWPTVDSCEPYTVVPTRVLPEEFTHRPSVRVMIGQASQYTTMLGDYMRMLFPNAAYRGIYGLTEATNIVMMSTEDDEQQHPGTLGHPLPGVDVRVSLPDGSPAAPGETGEILLRGAQVCAGYWNEERATDQLFAGGWLHTGDLAIRDEAGWIHFADRSKDMIKSGGENVYSAEVERVLVASPLVVEAAVLGVPDEQWTETVKAVVVLWDPRPEAIAELDAHCRAHIAGFKRPRWYEIVDAIPRNATNKVIKADLRTSHDPARCIRA